MPATDLSPLRLAIVAEARTWLGTPFRHQGRTRGAGVDCAGLVIGVARALELSNFDTTAYGRLPNGHAMRRICEVHLRPIPLDDAQPGDVLLMAWRRYPDDQGQVIAEFLDAGGALLGTIATPLQHVGTSGWVEVSASGAVPPGARQVRIMLRAVLVAGSVPNVAFDDISLIIEEQVGDGAGGQRAALVVVVM